MTRITQINRFSPGKQQIKWKTNDEKTRVLCVCVCVIVTKVDQFLQPIIQFADDHTLAVHDLSCIIHDEIKLKSSTHRQRNANTASHSTHNRQLDTVPETVTVTSRDVMRFGVRYVL